MAHRTRRLLAGLCTSVLVLSIARPALSQDTTLVISTWAPPTHVTNAVMWPGFVERLEELSDGRLSAEIKYDLAPPPAQGDLVLDGAADLTYIFNGYNPGRFATAQLIELPGYEGNAEAASVAYWRAHERYLSEADEYRGFKLVGLFTHGPAQLHTVEPINALDAVSGMKLRLPGGVGTRVGEALGAVGIQVPAPRVYETLASRAADGVTINMDSRTGFNLDEVAPHVFEIPGGFYRGSFAILMNLDAFERLPEALQDRLDAELFGEPVSRLFGAAWDVGDAAALEAANSDGDGSVTRASAADLERFETVAASVTAAVVEAVSGTGVDGAAARDLIATEMAGGAGAR